MNRQKKMPNSPINEVVKAWCEEYNASININRHRLFILSSIFFLALEVGIIIQMKNLIGFLFGLFFLCIAIFCIYKSFNFEKYRLTDFSKYQDQIVPDSLLEKLADSNDVPKSMKADIAGKLQKDSCVTFENLFELNRRFAQQKQAELLRAEIGNGYQKMMAYRDRDDK